MRLDTESNYVTESYIRGKISPFINKFWSVSGNHAIFGNKNPILIWGGIHNQESLKKLIEAGADINTNIIIAADFINFDRLYDNITMQQNAIEEGQKIDEDDGVAHIEIGSNYVIEDINQVNEIVFDNFEKNKDKLTIITIKNNGNINFPKMSYQVKNSTNNTLLITNDYYGKEEATYEYELNTFKQDDYYGNIIWNVPNATYITLAENAPFAGHLVAPNADVETPELHFAGCFIVNSLYCEGSTEAHFYPLTATQMDEVSIDPKGKQIIQKIDLEDALRKEETLIESKIIGDYQQYLKDMNKSPIEEILTNPATYRTFNYILILILIIGLCTLIKKNIKRRNINEKENKY